jgi:hypothetical protein
MNRRHRREVDEVFLNSRGGRSQSRTSQVEEANGEEANGIRGATHDSCLPTSNYSGVSALR